MKSKICDLLNKVNKQSQYIKSKTSIAPANMSFGKYQNHDGEFTSQLRSLLSKSQNILKSFKKDPK